MSIYDDIESKGMADDCQGWHSDAPIFAQLIEQVKPKVIIEVGTWKGASAIHMAKLAPDAKIYCVDTWLGGPDHYLSQLPVDDVKRDSHGWPHLYYQFLHNVKKAGVHERIEPIIQTSMAGAEVLKAKGVKADLIYIDGDHTFPGCLSDLVAYSPLLSENGVMFGDDFNWPTVNKAVLAFLERRPHLEGQSTDVHWVISQKK